MIGSIYNYFCPNSFEQQRKIQPPPPIDQSHRIVPLSPQQAKEKMLRNAAKAILEHSKEGDSLKKAYASDPQKAIPTLEALKQKEITPLKYSYTAADHIGPREQMEDAHFFTEIEQGILIGVFDGHGRMPPRHLHIREFDEIAYAGIKHRHNINKNVFNLHHYANFDELYYEVYEAPRAKEVADYASQEFQNRFSSVLKEHNGNAFHAFEALIHEIHQEVAKRPQWKRAGTTAVISFIDKETHQIITATLGDSEANLYRENKSIPLSAVRNWTSRKDAARLEKAMGWQPGTIQAKVYGGVDPKDIRWMDNLVNISRGIGDLECVGTLETPGVIHKPKITINKLQKGDVLILACDGLKDYVPEHEIVKTVMERNAWTISNIIKWVFNWIMTKIFCREPKGLAHDIVDYAIHKRDSKDNVTVVAVEIS